MCRPIFFISASVSVWCAMKSLCITKHLQLVRNELNMTQVLLSAAACMYMYITQHSLKASRHPHCISSEFGFSTAVNSAETDISHSYERWTLDSHVIWFWVDDHYRRHAGFNSKRSCYQQHLSAITIRHIRSIELWCEDSLSATEPSCSFSVEFHAHVCVWLVSS